MSPASSALSQDLEFIDPERTSLLGGCPQPGNELPYLGWVEYPGGTGTAVVGNPDKQ